MIPVDSATRHVAWSIRPTLSWVILVSLAALPAVIVVVPSDSSASAWAGVVTGIGIWTVFMVAVERREARRGHRDVPMRLRFAAGIFVLFQGVAALTAPSVVTFMYIPAMFLLTFGFILSWAGAFGLTLAFMLAGGVEAAAIVLSLAGLGVRIGWRTEFS